MDKDSVRLKLVRVQRLACVALTGAMKSAPRVTLDALPDKAPLHFEIIKEAALGVLRLLQLYKYLPGNFKDHLNILNMFPELV